MTNLFEDIYKFTKFDILGGRGESIITIVV